MSYMTQLRDRLSAISPRQWAMAAMMVLIAIAMTAIKVVAGDGGDEFLTIYDTLAGWLDGAPGRILAVLALGFSFFNVMKQNYVLAVGAFIMCLVLAQGADIIEDFLGAAVIF